MDVVVDSCSVRAKRGGDLTGPNPTDRGKRGTKYHIVVSTEGWPLGAVASAANVNGPLGNAEGGTPRCSPSCCASPCWSAPGSPASSPTPAMTSADNRWLCLREGIRPLIRKIGAGHGSGLGAVRSVVEKANAWRLNNKRLDRRHDRSAAIIQALLTTACIFVVANRLADL